MINEGSFCPLFNYAGVQQCYLKKGSTWTDFLPSKPGAVFHCCHINSTLQFCHSSPGGSTPGRQEVEPSHISVVGFFVSHTSHQYNIQIPARTVTDEPWLHTGLTLDVRHGSSVKVLSCFVSMAGWLETAKIPATGHLGGLHTNKKKKDNHR